jgi:hypothetical protein
LKKVVIIGIVIIIIGIIILVISNDQIKDTKFVENEKISEKEEVIDTTQKSGPFQINKSEYKIGEKIFLVVNELEDNDTGEILFLRAVSSTQYLQYETIPFDGKVKHTFNQYVEPKLWEERGVCSVEDIIGDWRIWFKGAKYQSLDFKIIDERFAGDKGIHSEPIC